MSSPLKWISITVASLGVLFGAYTAVPWAPRAEVAQVRADFKDDLATIKSDVKEIREWVHTMQGHRGTR